MSITVAISAQLNAPIQKVWEALTDSKAMKEWYFDIDDFRPEVGHTFEFYGGAYLHRCTVLEVVKYRKLVYSWSYPLYTGESIVHFLVDMLDEETTEVTLLHQGIESFPADDSNFSMASFHAGWEEIIHLGLKKYVEHDE